MAHLPWMTGRPVPLPLLGPTDCPVATISTVILLVFVFVHGWVDTWLASEGRRVKFGKLFVKIVCLGCMPYINTGRRDEQGLTSQSTE